MTQRPLRLAIPLACVIAAALSAAPAQAGTFRLRSCMAARGEGYDSAAFAGARSSARMTI